MEPAIHLSAIHRRFGDTEALGGVDLTVRSGEIVALLGPNGAGKSTTIEVILGLCTPDSGTVSVFGVPPRDAVRAGLVGAMLQSGPLLPDVTVGELVATYAALQTRPLDVHTVIERAGIGAITRQKTNGLSGGQAQRVRLALALVPDGELLVLDEPTVGFDVRARRDFWAAMHAATASGHTVLFATHHMDEADRYADRIVVLAGGRVVADGTGSEIRSTVANRTITATMDDAEPSELARLPGVGSAEVSGSRVLLACKDSDTTLRALLAAHPDVRDIEVRAGDLEEAFVTITDRSRSGAVGR